MSYNPPPSLEAHIIVAGVVLAIAATPFITIAALIAALAR